MEKIKLYIADTNQTYTNQLKEFLKDKIEVVGSTSNGKQALDFLKQNQVDLFLTEIVLEELDGFEVLANLQSYECKPKVIVNTTLSHDGFISKAVSQGANYYLIKPVDFSVLHERMVEVCLQKVGLPQPHEKQQKIKNKFLEEKITNIFITVGIPAHIKGYQYLEKQ